MSSLIKIIAEQATQPSDPFEEIPSNQQSGTPEEQRLEELQHKLRIATAMKASVEWVIQALSRDYTGTWSSTNTVPAGYVGFSGSKMFDLSKMSPADAALATRAAERYNKAVPIITKLQKDIKKQQKAVTVQKNAQAANVQPQATGQLAVGQIPMVIPNGRKGIDNPFFKHVGPSTQRYSGHPSTYGFSTPMLRMYYALEAMLKRNGQTLDKLYVGRVAGGHINFVATSANGKFVWYKYDMGGGSGQNHVFLNGTKMKSSSLVAMSAVQQDAELKRLGVV